MAVGIILPAIPTSTLTFHTCVPTPLAFTSNVLGTLSIVAWLFAQLPQIYKNWSISSTSGLSIFFLVEWCLGDFGNLLGALFTHQASWQVAIGGYYVFVDLCLVGQWMWYERLRHGSIIRRAWPRPGFEDDDARSGDMEQVVIEGVSMSPTSSNDGPQSPGAQAQSKTKQPTRPKIIFRAPTFQQESRDAEEKASSTTPGGTTIYRVGRSSPLPSPSPRTMLLIACVIALAQASPINKHESIMKVSMTRATQPTRLETAGTILSWMSTFLYLGSRLPQLFKNWKRKSTAGLSPHLFMAAFCGNLFYSSALLTNPCAWYDFAAYGGGGWVGAEGSDRIKWVLAALPFFLGAFGVLGLDASVGIQFLIYGEKVKVVVLEDEGPGRSWHWRRVSGWMRGWTPSSTASKDGEREALIERRQQHSEGYGTSS
ncbi:hypothetical protein LTR78_000611 [Recurvomyces mirabilis]|uniref:PQ loop repeat protein n=1 Tax=Recurvomyces mirabilis TaxID=574656 RepID=A0AAE0WY81_9PEZI|nr:hypothetical protein LTR78_000611 [Recurvomyces mirabilis]KAK5162265.1 hypothetical protein LTS14_000612 [Recurvomyces mirabilis]